MTSGTDCSKSCIEMVHCSELIVRVCMDNTKIGELITLPSTTYKTFTDMTFFFFQLLIILLLLFIIDRK